MSGRHEILLLGHEPCGKDVLTLRFSRPAGYDFAPGQWFTLTLETAEGKETKTFSHCSAPSDEYVEMTTRLSGSSFKKALASLCPGDHAVMMGPGGHLALDIDAERICFIVGGVGITPVRSILRDAAYHGRVFEDALLLYGNRDAACVPFAEEFERMADHGVRVVLCYEHPPEGWTGASGFITAELVREVLPQRVGIPFFAAGPPVMVSAMERVLDEIKVPDEMRHIERFGPAVHRGPSV